MRVVSQINNEKQNYKMRKTFENENNIQVTSCNLMPINVL